MLEKLLNKIQRIKIEKEQTEASIKSIETELGQITKDSDIIQKAIILTQEVIKEVQGNIQISITPLVNSALESVLEDKYQFDICFDSRGKTTKTTQAYFTLTKEDVVLDSLIDTSGGGLVNIVSFALRCSLLLLSKKAKVVLLDEPFTNLSKDQDAEDDESDVDVVDYQKMMVDILKKMCDMLDLQIIVVTHEKVFNDVADKIIRIKRRKGS